MIDITIFRTSLRSLGFYCRQAHLLVLGEPKKQGGGREDYTSVNVFLTKYVQKAIPFKLSFFGMFETIPEAESALYTVYGLLVTPGEHVISHSNGTDTEDVKAVIKKSTVKAQKVRNGLFLSVELEMLKTND